MNHFKIAILGHDGNLDAMKAIHQEGDKGHLFTQKVFDWTAWGGHLDVLKWLYQEYPDVGCTSDAIYHASEKNLVLIIRWLYKKGVHMTLSAVSNACTWGRLEALIVLHELFPSFAPTASGNVYMEMHKRYDCYSYMSFTCPNHYTTRQPIVELGETLFVLCDPVPLGDPRMNLVAS